MTGAYTEDELARLDELGKRRTAKARMDIRQRHLTEFADSGGA